MSKPKPKRNKPYRPREVNADAVRWAIAGATLLPANMQSTLMAPITAALDKLRRAEADREHWNELATALNIAEALAGLQIGPNLLPVIQAGQAALHDVALRMLAGARSTCKGPELAAITEAVDMYRIQLRLCTQAEMSRAVRHVKDLHRSGAMADVRRIYEGMENNSQSLKRAA